MDLEEHLLSAYFKIHEPCLMFDQVRAGGGGGSSTAPKTCCKGRSKMALRERLNLNLNDPYVLRRRRTSRCKFFNINNMLRAANLHQRRMNRLECAWDLSTNPLSEDCVNPFSDKDMLNGEFVIINLSRFQFALLFLFVVLAKKKWNVSIYQGMFVVVNLLRFFFTKWWA